MRTQDEEKKEALFKATVKVVNDIGFASSSVSKIAREAGVSPSTLYVYHENKEALLVSTYIRIKKHLTDVILADFDETQPLRDIIQQVWMNLFDYALKYQEYYKFSEQFANSPYSDLVDREMVESYFRPLINVIQRGIEQKIIKNVRLEILGAFIFHPVARLANPRFCDGGPLGGADIENAFLMAWDAIKL